QICQVETSRVRSRRGPAGTVNVPDSPVANAVSSDDPYAAGLSRCAGCRTASSGASRVPAGARKRRRSAAPARSRPGARTNARPNAVRHAITSANGPVAAISYAAYVTGTFSLAASRAASTSPAPNVDAPALTALVLATQPVAIAQ